MFFTQEYEELRKEFIEKKQKKNDLEKLLVQTRKQNAPLEKKKNEMAKLVEENKNEHHKVVMRHNIQSIIILTNVSSLHDWDGYFVVIWHFRSVYINPDELQPIPDLVYSTFHSGSNTQSVMIFRFGIM